MIGIEPAPVGCPDLAAVEMSDDVATRWGQPAAVGGMVRRRSLLVALLGIALGARTAEAQSPPSKVAVYGDSMAQGVGFMLNQALLRDTRFRVVNRAKSSTALGQPAYNWIEAVRASLHQDNPAFAVMMFGGNDRLAMRPPGGGPYVPFGSDLWISLYRARLETMLQLLADASVRIVWCGNPIAREPRYSRDMQFLNGIYRTAVEARGQIFIDTWPLFADEQGRFTAERRTHRGSVARVRAEDGIHMTAAGYGMVAHQVLANLEELSAVRGAPGSAPAVAS